MMKVFTLPVALLMFPGQIAASMVSLKPGSDHEQILRMFVNTVFWTFAEIMTVLAFVDL